MNKKTLALSGLALSSMMALGCGSPNNTDAGMGGSDSPVPTMEPITQTYIVGAINIPEGPDAMERVPGFNLDGMNTDGNGVGCVGGTVDFTSLAGEAGTDNQFVGMLTGLLAGFDLDLQMSVNEQISSGALLLAMRVNDINSFSADSSVTLELFLVRQADCAMSPCPVTGGVMAGQAWRQDAVSLTPTPLSATITAGQLRGSVPALPLAFETDGMNIMLTIRNAQVGAGITATGLTNGAIGGALNIDEVLMIAETIMPGVSMTVRPILEGNADIEPTADPAICGAISVGIGFTAVPALSIAPL